MIGPWLVPVLVQVVSVAALLGAWGWWTQRERAGLAQRRAGELERDAARLRALLEQANQALQSQCWARWWLINALESHPSTNPEREAQIRLAVAAFCVQDPAEYVAILRRVAASDASARNDRAAAQLVVSEWDAAERSGEAPWTTWARATGRPWAESARMRTVAGDALAGWAELLGPKQFAIVSATAQVS